MSHALRGVVKRCVRCESCGGTVVTSHLQRHLDSGCRNWLARDGAERGTAERASRAPVEPKRAPLAPRERGSCDLVEYLSEAPGVEYVQCLLCLGTVPKDLLFQHDRSRCRQWTAEAGHVGVFR